MGAKFALQLKPVGSHCNLGCSYCYAHPFLTARLEVMSFDVLERAISEVIANNDEPTITWHGGEPTLAGIEFYRVSQEMIQKYQKPGQKVRQLMQTNGTLVTPEFASFFREHGFEIGISIDGPRDIHNLNRVNLGGFGSFEKAMQGLRILREAGLDPSVIATVTTQTLPYAGEVFDFLVDNGFKSIKYSPVFDSGTNQFNITSEQWFEYLSVVFDHWMAHGDPGVSVLDLDEVIAWLDPAEAHPMCSSSRTCITWVSIDPDGTMYPCAYFRADMPYGNILTTSFKEVEKTSGYGRFRRVFLKPPVRCQQCEFFQLCGNGCPATRVLGHDLNPEGVYVYCEERKALFAKIKLAFEAETGSDEKGGS